MSHATYREKMPRTAAEVLALNARGITANRIAIRLGVRMSFILAVIEKNRLRSDAGGRKSPTGQGKAR